MTIEEALAEKGKAESKIYDAVSDFETKTGLKLTEINLHRLNDGVFPDILTVHAVARL